MVIALSISVLASSDKIFISTYNIKFIGYSSVRDNQAIANMLIDNNRDLVVVQELVSPPYDIRIGEKLIKGDKQSKEFFDAMTEVGYDYVLSEEDTGTGDKIHTNSSATEWFVGFYKRDKLTLIDKGFIAADRSNHDDYERVPYFTTFKTNQGLDFTIVSTHFKPGKGRAKKERRYHELASTIKWVNEKQKSNSERDYIILGDMNVYDCDVLDSHLTSGFTRASKECLNTNFKRSEPYDQVLYNKLYTSISNYSVVDMFKEYNIPRDMKYKDIIKIYSDHHPVFFELLNGEDDD